MTPRQQSWPGEPLEDDEDEPVEEPKAEAGPGLDEDEDESGRPRDDTEEPGPEDEEPAEELPRLRGPADAHAPGELDIPDEVAVLEGTPNGSRRGVAIVVARFNGEIGNRLLASALEELDRVGVPREVVTVMPVPGAFELPLAAMALAKTRRYACIVALGCVIRGETPHFEYVASEAASGLQLAALETGVPVAFGVLTVDTREQAEERIDRAADAVRTALEMADVFSQLRAQAAGPLR